MKRHGWYIIDGVQNGDRRIEQQVLGLESIIFSGRSVLETGTAEGLMAKWMVGRGASQVHGVDIVKDHIREAWKQCWGLPCSFEVHDLNEPRAWSQFDIVMALATLHKVRRPDILASSLARCCKEMVIRLPPENAPLVIDARSGNVPHDIDKVMREEGFALAAVTRGSFEEWCGQYVRTP